MWFAFTVYSPHPFSYFVHFVFDCFFFNNLSIRLLSTFILIFLKFLLEANYFTILWWFCYTFTWINHGCTCVHHPNPPSHLPPHPISQGYSNAPAPSTLPHASNLDWRSITHMLICMFQCYSLKSSHPCLLSQSPKVCSLHLCLFCCLAHMVIITFLSKFHIYLLIYSIGVFLSYLLYSV